MKRALRLIVLAAAAVIFIVSRYRRENRRLC